MLKNRLLMILLAGCTLAGSLHARATMKNHIPLKLSIEKDAVRVLKDGFAIITNKGVIKTKTLRSDANGLYVLEKDLYLDFAKFFKFWGGLNLQNHAA